MKRTKLVSFCSMAVAINFLCAFIALSLKLPIYLDSCGTIFASVILGPWWAMAVGAATSLINSTYDSYALYFMPVQLVVAFFAGLVKFDKNRLKRLIQSAFVSVPASVAAALIATYVFGTVTTSGSSYIVQFLRGMGLGDFFAVFVVQIFTDYIDKAICIMIIFEILKRKTFVKLR